MDLKKIGVFRWFFNVIKEYFLIILGIAAAGFGLKGFLIPNGFIDGGITGVSLLVSFLTPISASILIFIFNLPFMYLAIKQINKHFAIKTFVAILGLSLCLVFVNYPIITSDKLLVAIFGGFLLGAGIGLSVRGGSVLDGTEVLSVYLSKRLNLTIGEIIFIINVVIFSFAAVLLGIEKALYSLLTYLVAYKTVDFFIQGIEEYIGITIISEKSEEIRKALVKDLGKGVTIYQGKRGYNGDNNQDIVFTVVTRLETLKVKNHVLVIDPHAVVIEHGIKSAHGGVLKKRPLH
jgi:uncharacterized membrane-anchored protein YitT (DUF2179 family)